MGGWARSAPSRSLRVGHLRPPRPARRAAARPQTCSEPAPSGAGAVPTTGPESGFFRYVCTHYVLHHLETTTGYRIVLTSDAAAGDLRPVLWYLYEHLFTTYALRNPLYAPGAPIRCTGFVAETDRYLRALPAFTAK